MFESGQHITRYREIIARSSEIIARSSEIITRFREIIMRSCDFVLSGPNVPSLSHHNIFPS